MKPILITQNPHTPRRDNFAQAFRVGFVLLGTLGLLFLAGACSLPGEQIGTVNGEDIRMEDVEQHVTHNGAIPREVFETELMNAILNETIASTAFSELGITVGQAQIEEVYQVLRDQIENDGWEVEEFLSANNYTAERLRAIAEQRLYQEQVTFVLSQQLEITQADIDTEIAQLTTNFTNACLSHLLVTTEELVTEIRSSITNFEEFGQAAREYSIDPGVATNGGDLGCGPLDRFVPEFAIGALNVPIGTVSQPVRSQFGYHLIWVTSREAVEPNPDEVRSIILTRRAPSLYPNWLLEKVVDAEISLDENFGTWVVTPLPDIVSPT